MNRDDILRMAREVAGVTYPAGIAGVKIGMSEEHLERFAALVAAAEREKLKHELLTLEKWKSMALAKDGDGRTVQEIQREARVFCSCGDQIMLDDGALCGTCVSLRNAA
jgi:hypothetical protein